MGFYDSYGRHIDYAGTEYFRRCRFKGGSSTTVNNTTTYTPTEYELELQKAQANYSNAIAPNALWLNNTARKVLQDSLGTVQVDFNGLNRNAQNQINNANGQLTNIASGNTTAANQTNNSYANIANQLASANNATNNQLAALATGVLPSAYQQNMENSISSALTRTMGNTVNNLANRGVINSSVANSAMNDISRNAADTVAQQYANNINQVAGLTNQQYGNSANALGQQANLAGQQYSNVLNANNANSNIYNNAINNATAGITTAAAAQEAAQQPALNLWNASLGLNGATTSALAAAAGKGTTTSSNTSTTSGGGGFLSGLLGGL